MRFASRFPQHLDAGSWSEMLAFNSASAAANFRFASSDRIHDLQLAPLERANLACVASNLGPIAWYSSFIPDGELLVL